MFNMMPSAPDSPYSSNGSTSIQHSPSHASSSSYTSHLMLDGLDLQSAYNTILHSSFDHRSNVSDAEVVSASPSPMLDVPRAYSSGPSLMLQQENERLLHRLKHVEEKYKEKSERVEELSERVRDYAVRLRTESRSSWRLLRKVREQLEEENRRMAESLRLAERSEAAMRERSEELGRRVAELEARERPEGDRVRDARLLHAEETAKLRKSLEHEEMVSAQMSEEIASLKARVRELEGVQASPAAGIARARQQSHSECVESGALESRAGAAESPEQQVLREATGAAGAPASKQEARSVDGPEIPPSTSSGITRADTGEVEPSGATPPMLQEAADAVKRAMASCAESLLKFIQARRVLPQGGAASAAQLYQSYLNLKALTKLSIKAPGSSSGAGDDRPLRLGELRFALQSYLCSAFSRYFHDYTWGLPLLQSDTRNAYAARPKEAFAAYLRCLKSSKSARKLLDKEPEFGRIYHESFAPVLADPGLLAYPWMGSSLASDSDVKRRFLELAAAMWMLQKLAFSFFPAATMIRIPTHEEEAAQFDKTLMDSISDIDGAQNDAPKYVRFLCVPGFIIRRNNSNNIIIKARVACY